MQLNFACVMDCSRCPFNNDCTPSSLPPIPPVTETQELSEPINEPIENNVEIQEDVKEENTTLPTVTNSVSYNIEPVPKKGLFRR